MSTKLLVGLTAMKKLFMKIRHLPLFLRILLLISCLSAEAQNNHTDLLVKKTVTAWMKENKVPGVAVEVYENGKSHSYYFGYSNLKNKLPVNKDTIFEIASLSKLFTTLLIAEEVESSEINLSDPITRYLPKLSSNSTFNKISLKELASYTAGLPFSVPEDIKSRAELELFLQAWEPKSPIGSSWTYSNLSIGLLGEALEARNHESINELYKARILKPLGLQLIGIEVPKELKSHYAQGYAEDGKPIPASKLGLFPSAGSMKASGHDLLLFLKAALRLPGTPSNISHAMLLAQSSFAETPYMEQGLSWTIYPFSKYTKTKLLNPDENMGMGPIPAKQLTEPRFNGNAIIDKTGATYGFRSYIAITPNQQAGVVILANHYVSNGKIIKVGRKILLNLDHE